jgi:hypothetical protein
VKHEPPVKGGQGCQREMVRRQKNAVLLPGFFFKARYWDPAAMIETTVLV